MSLSDLSHKNLQFILFGGKGGVGKTTMASASAVRFAETRKTLIFTTDPAPSLADSLEQKLSNQPVKITGVPNLWAMEIDAKIVLEEFREEYGKDILDILQKGTYLSDKEAEEMFELDIPGLDEIMGLKKITDFMASREYDLYIVDTAPTGHTLRLLTLPELLDEWIKFLASLRWKYHYMVERFSGEKKIEKADEFLLIMKKTVKKVRELLQDPAKTEFIVVTIAEAMGVLETEDLINDLEKSRIPTSHIVINNIFPESKCDFCKSRRKNQEKYINEIEEKFSASGKKTFTITEVMLQSKEIKGIGNLKSLAGQLFPD
ncbi:MAG: ArsA family ATPase [Candidatus Yanofskybacteria bacterium]|nr:ArsA family ATPase [Candidatus Yanofskybacteria bacterium]